jgi:hypothetical protein
VKGIFVIFCGFRYFLWFFLFFRDFCDFFDVFSAKCPSRSPSDLQQKKLAVLNCIYGSKSTTIFPILSIQWRQSNFYLSQISSNLVRSTSRRLNSCIWFNASTFIRNDITSFSNNLFLTSIWKMDHAVLAFTRDLIMFYGVLGPFRWRKHSGLNWKNDLIEIWWNITFSIILSHWACWRGASFTSTASFSFMRSTFSFFFPSFSIKEWSYLLVIVPVTSIPCRANSDSISKQTLRDNL